MQKVIRILQLRIFGDEGERSTSSREVSPASPFQSPASEGARRTAVTSGLTCSVPFTRSGPVGSLVRTLVASSRWYSPARRLTVGCQPSLFGEDQPVYRKREEYVVETICRDLEREGYTVQPLLIPACAVGAPAQKGPRMVCCPRRWRGITARGDRIVSRRGFRKSSARCYCPPRQRRRYTTGNGWNTGNVRGARPCTRQRTGRRTPTV